MTPARVQFVHQEFDFCRVEFFSGNAPDVVEHIVGQRIDDVEPFKIFGYEAPCPLVADIEAIEPCHFLR